MSWEDLSRDKDVIINFVDLLSFFMVTPELFRVMAPALSNLLLITTIFILLLPAAAVAVQYLLFDVLASVLDFGVALGIYTGFIIVFLHEIFKRRRLINAWTARHALILGVFLFAGNRLFALVIATHEIFHVKLVGEIGPDLFRAACTMGLEGLVSKRRDWPYRGGRSPDWIKVKNRKHPAMERVMEAI